MTRLHEGQGIAKEVAQIRRETIALSAWIRRNAAADAGLAHDAFQEAVEACLLEALADGRRLPGPDELSVEPEEYLLGLADTIGEVRRLVLADLAHGTVDRAEARLVVLEALYRLLLRFETTRAIVPLKPKQDAARGILERTRGEVTLARVLDRARLPATTAREASAP